jgi:hypothetical protein
MMDNSGMDTTASDISQTPVQEVVQQQNERLFKQSEINEIVGRAKHDAVESFKRQNTQQTSQQQYAQQPQAQRDALSQDDVRRLASEELSRQRDDWEKQTLERHQADAAQRIVNTYKEKIAAGKEKFEDFDAVTNNVDMRYYPNVVQLLAEHVDNASEILYELACNRYKLNNLETTCERNPQDAIYEIRRLSDSIKANDQSSNRRTSNSPLSQQRPSNTGTDSGGALSMADLRRKYKG